MRDLSPEQKATQSAAQDVLKKMGGLDPSQIQDLQLILHFGNGDFEGQDMGDDQDMSEPESGEECPHCGNKCDTPYCPMCGTKMPEPQEPKKEMPKEMMQKKESM